MSDGGPVDGHGDGDVEALVAVEAIRRLKYRYLRCLDQKLWDELEGCLAEDATASYGGGSDELAGRDEVMAFLRARMGDTAMLSSHRCGHPEIELAPPVDGAARTATGTWALQDTVVLTDLDLTIEGAAFYEDRYRRDPDGWCITHTGYRRTYEQIWPRSSVPGLRLTADWWGTDGRSSLTGDG